MSISAIPFNVELLVLNQANTQGLRQVKVLDNFDTSGVNFHDDGLFSTLTFGKVGTERRSKAFAYIDIKVPILHPLVFKVLTDMHSFYGEVMAGKCYAVWNNEVNDFVKADESEGSTGYNFFFKNWERIKFEKTGSPGRIEKVELLEKYRATSSNTKIVVLPAALRDIEENDGRFVEDEVNAIYRKMIAISNAIPEAALKNNIEAINTSRWNLQVAFNDLFEYYRGMIDGKKKLIMGRWASRRVFNSTRNVLTAMDPSPSYLGGEGAININSTVVGLYQAMKAILPVTIFNLRNGYIKKVFVDPAQPVKLVNKKTLKVEEVMLKPAYFDRWNTDEGIEQLINRFSNSESGHNPITIDNRYFSLTYLGPDGTFKIITDIDSIPETRDKAHVHPTTYAELFYASLYHLNNKFPAFVTRYPITGLGSIYPSIMYFKTTVNSELRVELGESWTVDSEAPKALDWPIQGEAFINSLIPHVSKLARLGADFDGDTGSFTCTYTDESIKEVFDFLKKKQAYIGPDGRIMASSGTDTINYVMHNLSEV